MTVGLTPVAEAAPAMPPEISQACQQTSAQYISATPSIVAALGMNTAWAYSTGAHVTVAVVDSGVDTGNAHLSGKNSLGQPVVLPGYAFGKTGPSLGQSDDYGLGTAIAGLIAAQSVPGSGLKGLAYNAQILPVRVYDQPSQPSDVSPSPNSPTPAATAAGITWAADQGSQIIVVPATFSSDDPALAAAVAHADSVGALVIAPVGDASEQTSNAPASSKASEPVDTTTYYPAGNAKSSTVLAVTAVSSQGAATTAVVQNATVQLAVPGTDAVSTYLALGDCTFTDNNTPSSIYATGYAAGLAALVASRFPHETPAQWAYRLQATASRPVPALRDNATGWGVVNPTAALTFVNDGTAVGPVDPLGQVTPKPASTASGYRSPTQAAGLPTRDRITLIVCAGLAIIAALAAGLAVPVRKRRTSARSAPA